MAGSGFYDYTSFTEIDFASDSYVQEIDGFHKCTSLCRIELPVSIKAIDCFGLSGSISVDKVLFSSDSHLPKIEGIVR
jgi:hypothetical protein